MTFPLILFSLAVVVMTVGKLAAIWLVTKGASPNEVPAILDSLAKVFNHWKLPHLISWGGGKRTDQ